MPATIQHLDRLLERKSPEELPFLRKFAEILFRKASPDFLEEFDAEALLALTLGARDRLREHRPGELSLRLYDPRFETEGWERPCSVLEIALDDRPFIVDSVRNELVRQGVALRHVLHPIFYVHRDPAGKLLPDLARDEEARREAVELYFVEPVVGEEGRQALLGGVRAVLEDVIAATGDHGAMLARAEELRAALAEERGRTAEPERAEELEEAEAFLGWLADGNFLFLGYREYDLVDRAGIRCLQVEPASGLGILRRAGRSSYAQPVPVDRLPEGLRQRVLEGPFLLVTKANAVSTVHRPVRMDYVGLKKLDGRGSVSGERRFLGLFTSQAMTTRFEEVPILRRKLRQVLALDDAIEGSHDSKQMVSVFNSMPLEELFWSEAEQLHRDIRTVMAVQEGTEVRLTLRPDPLGRGLMVMVVMPRDRFSAGVRQEIQALLSERLQASRVEYQLSLVEAEGHARLHFFLTTDLGLQAVNQSVLEREVTELTRNWQDRLRDRLVAAHGEARGRRLWELYGPGISESYRASVPLGAAVRDLENLEALGAGSFGLDLANPVDERFGQPATHLRIYHRGRALVLSDSMPILENLGLRVLEQASFALRRGDGEELALWGMDLYRVQDLQGRSLDLRAHKERLVGAALAVLGGRAENDRLNRLVLLAGLTVRQVALLRAYQMYHSQLSSGSRQFLTATLLRQPRCAALLVQWFEARFRPEEPEREQRVAEVRRQFLEALNEVASLPEDRALRALFNVIEATVRTNYFQERDFLSFKIRSADVAVMPEPRPLFEIVVVGPGVEAIHLRGGRVARGGLRWSDRPDDFRTEVLGLMKTQMVKNAVIVPVGAKGAFVLKGAPASRDALQAWLEEQYRVFIRGMLELTDNMVAGKVVQPAGLVIYDPEPDPYLVVAADKGTAAMSDVANDEADRAGFWLGDAFASGGTQGYDHKKEGITARGAWECVSRHFRELGLDIDRDEFTAVGVGDMAGDVFGNGMLRTNRLKLLGAFNHLHIFLDPDPDPEKSFWERQRMFALPRSTWDDYDRSTLSEGGGIHSRHAKSIALTPQVQAMLGTDSATMSGEELVRALLTLPVDLLWNGGIGTYVRASSERDADVGDSANDAVRVTGRDLRCRVVGEGGNGGFTQLARVEYALAGGRINTDAVDNSGGVDMSDREVNIKILMQPLLASGELTMVQRNRLLAEMTDEVSALVLRDNYAQSLCLSLAHQRSQEDPDLFASLLDFLSERGELNRRVEFLPERKALQERALLEPGLTRPELAVLMAYTKQGLSDRILQTDLPDEPALQHVLTEYFPRPLQQRFAEEIRRHRLHREILATQLISRVVDLLGITYVHRTIRDTGAGAVAVLKAALATLEILEVPALLERLYATDNQVPSQVQYRALHRVVQAVQTAASGMLLTSGVGDMGACVEGYRTGLAEFRHRLEEMLPEPERARFDAAVREWSEAGVADDLAADLARLEYLPSALGVVDVSRRSGLSCEEAARCYYLVGERLALGWLRDRLQAVRATDKWEKIAVVGLTMDLQDLQRELTLAALQDGGELPQERLRRYDRSLAEARKEAALSLASGAVLARLLSQAARG